MKGKTFTITQTVTIKLKPGLRGVIKTHANDDQSLVIDGKTYSPNISFYDADDIHKDIAASSIAEITDYAPSVIKEDK